MLIWNELVSLILISIGLIMVIPHVIELIPLLFSRKKRKKIDRFILIMASIGWSVLATQNIVFRLDNAWYWIPVLVQSYLVFSTLRSLKELENEEGSHNNFVINVSCSNDKNIDPQELAESIFQISRKDKLK